MIERESLDFLLREVLKGHPLGAHSHFIAPKYLGVLTKVPQSKELPRRCSFCSQPSFSRLAYRLDDVYACLICALLHDREQAHHMKGHSQ